jgi:hypothetical protein
MKGISVFFASLLAAALDGSPIQAASVSSPGALSSPPSAQAAVEYLRRVMDEYHNRFPVYDDVSSGGNHFHAWAKIPDENAAVDINGSSTDSPHSGATAIRAELHDTTGTNFGGFYFLNGLLPPGATAPVLNFGTTPNAGIDLTGATALTFWARGQQGGETISFFMGGVGRDPNTGQPVAPYPDSTPVIKQVFVLSPQWLQYSLDLGGADLHYVLGGFGWVASAVDNPGGAVFFVDDISYQLGDAARAARLAQPRFLRSFTTGPYQALPPPVGIFDLAIRQVAFSYDNAVALLAFLAEGSDDSLRRARLIGDAFVYANTPGHDRSYDDGRVRDAYAAGDLTVAPGWTPNGRVGTVAIPGYYDETKKVFYEVAQDGISTGNNAWAMLSLVALYRRTLEPRYLDAAKRIGQFVVGFRNDQGAYQGFQGGLDQPEGGSPVRRPWASTEHNLDLVAGFRLLAALEPGGGWGGQADHARQLVDAMWDESRGCNLTGTTDPATRNPQPLPEDVQSWAVLALPDALTVHPGLLGCAERNHLTTDAGYHGFDFNEDRDGVWFEGTAQMATAYQRAGRPQDAGTFTATLGQAQGTPPFGDGFGIAAASRDGLTTGFSGFLYFLRLHVGATAWTVFAQLGFNPFTANPIAGGPATNFYTLTPCRIADTRNAAGPLGGPALQPDGAARVLPVLSAGCGIPSGAAALAVNVTVTQPAAQGLLRLFAADQPLPGTSVISFSAGQTRANNAIVSLPADGSGGIAVKLESSGSVQVIVDVTGYFL